MSKKELSNYQKDIVGNYYANLNAIMLQKLGELVSELYLAENDGQKKRLWQRVHKAMMNLKIPPAIIKSLL